MAGLQSFHDWQEAEYQADMAQKVCTAAIRAGGLPTHAQLEDVVTMRVLAVDMRRALVETMRAATRSRMDHRGALDGNPPTS